MKPKIRAYILKKTGFNNAATLDDIKANVKGKDIAAVVAEMADSGDIIKTVNDRYIPALTDMVYINIKRYITERRGKGILTNEYQVGSFFDDIEVSKALHAMIKSEDLIERIATSEYTYLEVRKRKST